MSNIRTTHQETAERFSNGQNVHEWKSERWKVAVFCLVLTALLLYIVVLQRAKVASRFMAANQRLKFIQATSTCWRLQRAVGDDCKLDWGQLKKEVKGNWSSGAFPVDFVEIKKSFLLKWQRFDLNPILRCVQQACRRTAPVACKRRRTCQRVDADVPPLTRHRCLANTRILCVFALCFDATRSGSKNTQYF